MKNYFLLILFFHVSIGFAQNPLNEAFKDKPDGPYFETYGNGNPFWRYNKVKGNLHGEYITYFKNGIIDSYFLFDNGKFHGKNFRLNEKGDTISIDISYHDTLLFYREIEYYKNGKINTDNYYDFTNNGQPSLNNYPKPKTMKFIGYFTYDITKVLNSISNKGSQLYYYSTGKLKARRGSINGKFEGINTEYYESGKLKLTCEYKNGKLDGEFVFYNEEGKMTSKELYKDGKKIKNLPID